MLRYAVKLQQLSNSGGADLPDLPLQMGAAVGIALVPDVQC